MSKNLDPAVLELLASRICHDLISPVGAVHNGIEFLEEMGVEAGAEAIALISHSAQQAAARLQVFRIAYGAGGRDTNIKPSDVKNTFSALVDIDGKIRQDWDATAITPEELPVGYSKMLMGMLMMAAECLPKGGTIRAEKDGAGLVRVTAEGPDAAARPQVAEALAGSLSVQDLDPRLVHPHVLANLAGQYGFRLTLDPGEKGSATFRLAHAAG